MKSFYTIHDLGREAHLNEIPRRQFLASMHPKERSEAAKIYDELEVLAKLPGLPAEREILHHKLTVNTRKVCTVSSRDVDPVDLMLLAGLLRDGGGAISTENMGGKSELPNSDDLVHLEIRRHGKARASIKFAFEGFALTLCSWAGDLSATADAWKWLERLWIGAGDVDPGFLDSASNLSMPEPPMAPWIATIILPPLSNQQLLVLDYISRLTSALGVLLQHDYAR